jgi:hypothetical protein
MNDEFEKICKEAGPELIDVLSQYLDGVTNKNKKFNSQTVSQPSFEPNTSRTQVGI